jgi:hypothetical protein
MRRGASISWMVDSMFKPYVCQRKIVPTSRGPSIVEASMSGSQSDQEEMSVCRRRMFCQARRR